MLYVLLCYLLFNKICLKSSYLKLYVYQNAIKGSLSIVIGNDNKLYESLPMIIVPGDGGSKAYSYNLKTKETNHIWFNLKYMLFPTYLKQEFKLNFNFTSSMTQDAKGFKILFPGWGDTEPVENLNSWKYYKTAYFQNFIQSILKDSFYVKNKTLRAAPYDFRKSPIENQKLLKNFAKLVEETFRNAKNKRVVILAHSLGSLVSLHFLKTMDEVWKKTYIHAFIATAAPLGGSVKALLLETSGSSFGLPRDSILYRDVERSFSSTSYLLPRPFVFASDQILVQSPFRNYTANDYFSLFQDMNFLTGYEMFQQSLTYFDADDALLGIDNIHCVHGIDVETPEMLIYNDPFPDGYPEIKFGNGDGTVNLNSLRQCLHWKGVRYFIIKNVNHNKILSDPSFVSYVRSAAKVF